MKIKCELIVDTDSGNYSLQFHNMDKPGEDIDFTLLEPLLPKIFQDVGEQMESPKPDKRFTKLLH